MVEFKLAIGDPKSKKTYKAELSGSDADKLIGKKLGDKIKGELLDLAGYELEITGGSDSSGFPMRADVNGARRKKIVLSGGVGFHSKRKGERRRKSVRGNTISADISQLNCKVVKAGSKAIADVLSGAAPKEEKKEGEKKEKTKEEEKSKEAPKEEKKPEGKPAEKPKEESAKEEKKEKETSDSEKKE